jgi:hypothetical protein
MAFAFSLQRSSNVGLARYKWASARDRRQYPFGARGQGRNHGGADRLCDWG